MYCMCVCGGGGYQLVTLFKYVSGNGPQVLGNGPHLLGIMSHSGLCCIRYHVAFGVMSFGIMLSGIMSHSGLS